MWPIKTPVLTGMPIQTLISKTTIAWQNYGLVVSVNTVTKLKVTRPQYDKRGKERKYGLNLANNAHRVKLDLDLNYIYGAL